MLNKTWPWMLGTVILITILFLWGGSDDEENTWTSKEVEIDGLFYRVSGIDTNVNELHITIRVKNEGDQGERLKFDMQLQSDGKKFEPSKVESEEFEMSLNPSSRTTMTAIFKGSVSSMLESPVLVIETTELPISK